MCFAVDHWRLPGVVLSLGMVLNCLKAATRGGLRLLLIWLVRAYQIALSPLLVGSCKFVPSCSQYFILAVREHGPWRGTWLGVKRLCRCHPFGPGGYDPVPPRGDLHSSAPDGCAP
jgi:putative membrane protein insertion efficiency factor